MPGVLFKRRLAPRQRSLLLEFRRARRAVELSNSRPGAHAIWWITVIYVLFVDTLPLLYVQNVFCECFERTAISSHILYRIGLCLCLWRIKMLIRTRGGHCPSP